MSADADAVTQHERKPHTPAAAVRVFSLSERIGRVRYLVYTLAAGLACSLMLYAAYALASILPPALGKLVATLAFVSVKYMMLPVIFCILSIRRLHDFNASGWWSLAVMIPLVALVFLAIPGSKLDNRFGSPPPANSEIMNIAAALAPVLLIWVVVNAYQKREGAQVQAPQRAPQSSGIPSKPAGEPLKPYTR